MIDISKYIEQIKAAVYGCEVRKSICDALETMATEASDSVAIAVQNATDSRNSAKIAEDYAKAAEKSAQGAYSVTPDGIKQVVERVSNLESSIDLKANKNIGSENHDKFMQVDASGNVIPQDLPNASATTQGVVKLGDDFKVDSKGLLKLATVEERLKALEQKQESGFPIGYVMITKENTNPGTWTAGTWEAFAKGKMLISADDSSTYSSNGLSYSFKGGTTGGEYNHKLIIDEMPSHNHSPLKLAYEGPNNSPTGLAYAKTSVGARNFDWLAETGGNQPHNNLPPYLAAYMWVRIK